MYAVDVTATDTFSKGTPEKIFEGNYFIRYSRRFDIHPDGDKFIMIQTPEVTPQEQKDICHPEFFRRAEKAGAR